MTKVQRKDESCVVCHTTIIRKAALETGPVPLFP